MLKEFIEKQYFIVNLNTRDIADEMFENGDKTEDEIASSDMVYINQLFSENDLTMEKLEGSGARIIFNNNEKALFITLDANEKEHGLSLLEFLEL